MVLKTYTNDALKVMGTLNIQVQYEVVPYKASVHIQQGVKPHFLKPHLVPFSIRDAVGREPGSLEQQGIIRKVNNSAWAACQNTL